MIYALIVIYNKACEESITLKSIYKWKNSVQIVFFDNSTVENNNEKYCSNEGFIYLSEKKNVGLSKAYNYAIKSLKLKAEDYVLILDDDTELNDEYLQELIQNTNESHEVILPFVYSGNSILSPSKIVGKCKSQMIKDTTEIDVEHITAINSGMMIKGNVYEKVQYNEELFLDYVDHDFMKRIRDEKFRIHILEHGIRQNFSRDEKPELEKALFRFKLYKKDFKEYCEANHARCYYYLSISKFVLNYSLKYRTLRFLI